jgi:N-acetylated-alpha-linked acidic dipeptidase
LLAVGGWFAVSVFSEPPSLSVRGFTTAHSEWERDLESKFMTVPDSATAERVHKRLTLEPHMAGSPADRRTAEYVLQEFRRYGLEAFIEEFDVVLSEPIEVKVELLGPVRFTGPTPEFVPQDPASNDVRAAPGFNAFSASGDVTAGVVYANYGLRSDYDLLRSKGVSVEGKIVIARYGRSYRGAKVRIAEENKAGGVILYSDPQDDGYHAGIVYPHGPWRPSSGVQRGSVLYDFIYPGLLPDGSNVPHIPVLPLSYGDAQHILGQLGGLAAPRDWQGGLPFTYCLGGGLAKVRMRVRLKSPRRVIWNVVAKISGTAQPEQIVVAGNHRDAWVYGGVDPNSGTTAMLEMARGLGELVKNGWRPQRSIWLCSWDAEEQDEFGSSRWAEKHASEIQERAVAYLNVDTAVSGDRFGAESAPSLKTFLREVASDVPDPHGDTILAHAENRTRVHTPYAFSTAQQKVEFGNLGGGADYVAFFDHFGIPSTDFSFEGDSGIYHSIFDDHLWMERFGDPKFLYHVAAARFLGLEILRLAGADLLPFDYETYGLEIMAYLKDLDGRLTSNASGVVSVRPACDADQRFIDAAAAFSKRFELKSEHDSDAQHLDFANRTLVRTEQAFLTPEGLPGRPWYKHVVFAPGIESGYKPKVLPGVSESIDSGNVEEAQRQLQILVAALNRAADTLNGTVH